MVTLDMLKTLKFLAVQARPYIEDEPETMKEETEEEEDARRQANSQFFFAAYALVPELVDEILMYRDSPSEAA